MRMRHIVICGLSGSTIFSTLSHKRHDFRKKKLLSTKCVSIFCTNFFPKCFSFSEVISALWSYIYIYIYICLRVRYPLFSSHFKETWIFSTDFRKIFQHKISLKSVQWEHSCSTRMGRRTDRHNEGNSRFSQFCESARNILSAHPCRGRKIMPKQTRNLLAAYLPRHSSIINHFVKMC